MDTKEQTVFGSGFFALDQTNRRQFGESQLGDGLAEALAASAHPEISPPDELTVRRRMAAASKVAPKKAQAKRWPFLATAAAGVVLVVGVSFIQLQGGDSACGQLGDGRAITSCGHRMAAVTGLVQRRFPGDELYKAVGQRKPVYASHESVTKVLRDVDARFIVFEVPEEYTDGDRAHGLALVTSTEKEFMDVRKQMALNRMTLAVATELTRIARDESPNWSTQEPVVNVLSLVSLH